VIRPLALALAGCNAVLGIKSTKPVPDAPPDSPSGCPSGYGDYDIGGGKLGHYRFVGEARTFSDAEVACVMDGGALANGLSTHLAVTAAVGQPIAELNALYEHRPAPTEYWIGLSDRPDGVTFQWITDEPVPVAMDQQPPWAGGEPARFRGNCVELVAYQAALFVIGCANLEPFICECDSYPEDLTHY
jgi:hypothetical protein